MNRLLKLRILIAISAVILLGTAVFHATGYSPLSSSVAASTLPAFFRRTIPGIWLFFSWHLVAIATALGWISISRSRNVFPLLVFSACVLCVDTLFVFSLAGIFPGTILLFIAAATLVICSVRWNKSAGDK